MGEDRTYSIDTLSVTHRITVEVEPDFGIVDNLKVDFGFYSGSELMGFQFPPKTWLIEGMLYCGDSVLFLGAEKSGKSIAVKQVCAALTSGSNFLGLPVVAPQRVCYLQLEGEISDTQDRFNRMARAVPFNPHNFMIGFLQPQSLQDMGRVLELISGIEEVMRPQVIIIDPLYMAMVGGDLNDSKAVCSLIASLRILKMYFGCTLILVHHTHKVKLNTFGEVIGEGDNASFGSVFLKAWPDHVLLLRHDKKSEVRYLSCGTQRSGQIEKDMTLELVQPNPLYFKPLSNDEIMLKMKDHSGRILNLLEKRGVPLQAKEIYQALEISRMTFYGAIKHISDKFEVVGKAPHSRYRLKNG